MNLNWSKLIELNENGVSIVNEVPGVYRLSYANLRDGKIYVYYVGQAANIKTRMEQHLPNTEVNECCKKYLNDYKCYFRLAIVNNQADRDGAEVALYNHFSPSCPEKIPDVQAIEINF